MDNGQEYYVKLAEEQQQMEEETAAGSEQRNDSQHVLELAFDMGLNLNSKRSRDTSSLAVYVDKFENYEQLRMEKSGGPYHAPPAAMIVVSWNCRGIVAPLTVSELRSICKSLRPSVLFLMETKASNLSYVRTRRKLGFDNIFCVESRGLSGGLCLFWKSNNIIINVYAWCENFIKAQISTVNNNVWEGIFVYGHPDFKRRNELWNELTCVDNNLHVPRAFIGEFNDVIAQHEKVGLHPKPTSQIDIFRRFVDKNALMDFELQGTKFTWFSNPRNGFVTKERIDRVLANWEWRRAFQHATISALPAMSSDYTPLVLNAFWADHADCGNIIRRGWNSVCNSTVDYWTNLTRRMNSCKQELVKWSKINFKRADMVDWEWKKSENLG
ncbi:hypothetical protein Ahy_B10g104568 [Arachis hypogaea]|uniref:Endonuclease/exonuclease/phosphatase domain-containing protein n=1 Tax=Arachis hypogaea TaxID=3818 RepID=A0A444X5V3_ARAHY|nr:hypothetical protein Ahy_B10g104568 [Arachis hypogaea]